MTFIIANFEQGDCEKQGMLVVSLDNGDRTSGLVVYDEHGK